MNKYIVVDAGKLLADGEVNFKSMAQSISDAQGIDCDAFDLAAERVIVLNEQGIKAQDDED